MKIWHISDMSWTPNAVNGVSMAVRAVAREQAQAGHQVSVLIEDEPTQDAVRFCEEHGIEILAMAAGVVGGFRSARSLIKQGRPDIVHMHSVFTPQHAVLAMALNRAGVPYLTTPHGGLARQVLERGRLKKFVYGLLVEKPRMMRARGLSLVAPGEVDEIRSYVPKFDGLISWVPNPVDAQSSANTAWDPAPGRPRIVFLGRFDVHHKGIDLLIDIARHLPEADFELYGDEDARTKPLLDVLRKEATPNVRFCAPIFGSEKLAVLSRASFYLQPSRWEAFGISVAEAMSIGVPCAITQTMNLAQLFRNEDLGLVIPNEAKAAASAIRDHLNHFEQLSQWSVAGRKYVATRLNPALVADQFVDVYRRCCNIVSADPLFAVADPNVSEIG
jgi:glycosyltransferase involved in cell wall biosynthesis